MTVLLDKTPKSRGGDPGDLPVMVWRFLGDVNSGDSSNSDSLVAEGLFLTDGVGC